MLSPVRAVHRRGDVGAAGPRADGRAGRLARRRPRAAGRGDRHLRRPGRRQGAGPAATCRPTSPRTSCATLALADAGGGDGAGGATVRTARHRAAAQAGQHRPGLSGRRDRGCLSHARSVAVVTDSTAYLPADGLAERHGDRASSRCRWSSAAPSYDEGEVDARRRSPRRCARGTPVTTSRPTPAAFAEVYARRGRGRCDRRSSRCTCPPTCPGRYDSARSPPRPTAAGPGARRGLAGASRWGSASRSLAAAPRPPSRRGRPRRWRAPRGDRARGDHDAVLRRHPRVPAPGRADRRRRRRCSASALAVKPMLHARRRPDRAAGEGAYGVPGHRPARGARRRGGRRTAPGRRRRAPPRRAGAGRASSPSGSRPRSPQVGGLLVAEVGAVVGAHVGPGMLAVVVAPR